MFSLQRLSQRAAHALPTQDIWAKLFGAGGALVGLEEHRLLRHAQP